MNMMINTFQDIIDALERDPKAREDLRRHLLDPENLPANAIDLLERILKENPEIRERLRRALLAERERELPEIVERMAAEITRMTETIASSAAQADHDRNAIRKEMAEGFARAESDRNAIRQEMAEGFKQAAEDRNAIRQEMAEGFKQAAEDRNAIRQEMADGFARAESDRNAIRQEMAEGFKQAAEDRNAIRQEMAEGFARAESDRNAIRQEMAEGFRQAAEDRNAIRQNLSEFIKTTNDNFQLVNERLSRLETDVQEIKGDIHQINGRLDRMDRRFDRIDGRLDNALGANYETKVRRNIGSIAGQFLQMRQVKILGPESPRDRRLEETIDQAEQNGSITQPAYHDLWQLDLIIHGIHSPGNTPLLAAIEISITAGDDDIERAASRRDTLKQAIGETPVIPVVIAANMDQERQSLADRLKVTIITHPEN